MAEPNFCPVCGRELGAKEEGGRLRPACSHCGYIHYHNPVPAVGILIEMDGGVVLIRRGQPPNKGAWTLPSGFVEADESAEEAAIREAREETGLKVEIVELAGVNSFPEGPPISGIMIFYYARPVGGRLQAGDDADDVLVFMPEDVPPMPFRTHRELMAQWLTRRNGAPSAKIETEAPFSIHPAAANDMEDVLGLLGLIPANRNLTEEQWGEIALRYRERAGFDVFVAEVPQPSGLIVGFIALSSIRSLTEGRGFINDMAVLPTYQRRGVGAALLEAVMRQAGRLNLHYLMVNQERANEQARAFYRALGFSSDPMMCLKLK